MNVSPSVRARAANTKLLLMDVDGVLTNGKLYHFPDEVAYMGDDLTDLVVMRRVGFAIAVANARPEVMREAHYVTERSGGEGAVREVIEIILDAWGFWGEILDKYEVRRK